MVPLLSTTSVLNCLRAKCRLGTSQTLMYLTASVQCLLMLVITVNGYSKWTTCDYWLLTIEYWPTLVWNVMFVVLHIHVGGLSASWQCWPHLRMVLRLCQYCVCRASRPMLEGWWVLVAASSQTQDPWWLLTFHSNSDRRSPQQVVRQTWACKKLPIKYLIKSIHPSVNFQTKTAEHKPPRYDMKICGNTLLGASWCRTHRRNWRATLTQLPGTITPLLTTT